MKYITLTALLLLPSLAYAQAPSSQAANFVAALATNLNTALAQNDKLEAQVAELQKELDAAKKPVAEPAKPH